MKKGDSRDVSNHQYLLLSAHECSAEKLIESHASQYGDFVRTINSC